MVILGTGIVVGAGTGLGAVLFIALIALLQRFFFDGVGTLLGFLGRGALIFIPAAGGLLAGPIIAYFASEAKGHGVPEVMQAIALRGGRTCPGVVTAKIIASALYLDSGGSADREGPIVQVGAAIGSTVGQWLHLSEARIRNLVACGSAAGVAVTFNAPIAGVVFAMEIILGEFHLGDLSGQRDSCSRYLEYSGARLPWRRSSFLYPGIRSEVSVESALLCPSGHRCRAHCGLFHQGALLV